MESRSTPKGDRSSSTAYHTDGTLVEPPRHSIPEPEPAHIPDGIPDDEREAQELHEVATAPRQRMSRVLSPGTAQESCCGPVKKFWRHHVRIDVPHVDCRDHLVATGPRSKVLAHYYFNHPGIFHQPDQVIEVSDDKSQPAAENVDKVTL
ncbi:hypothetical protein AC579_2690 [Pseudocercospora musae]|uniref:Uncharacterized protein n=1 Tax=Pseudocercospora musae TaxID=113226 RepID=A0A139IVE5_9PEZI|nr:hypothetical protein AC579_2690 [Pseudocercospora musae]KXT18729.1 hypothetical protein AC579_2690 [Pseudocercospora musae]